jgi:hypothetical protein
MDTVDLEIIEAWHMSGNDLMMIDRMQWKEITSESLLATRNQYKRDRLSFVQTARLVFQTQEK